MQSKSSLVVCVRSKSANAHAARESNVAQSPPTADSFEGAAPAVTTLFEVQSPDFLRAKVAAQHDAQRLAAAD
jgi:hypothetical protein